MSQIALKIIGSIALSVSVLTTSAQLHQSGKAAENRSITKEAILIDGTESTGRKDFGLKRDTSNPFIYPKNSLFIEILGCGGMYSLNYERLVFHRKRHAIYVRAGGGTYPWYQGTRWTFPILTNYRFALCKSVSFEAGIGGSYIHENKYWQSSTIKHDMFYLNGTFGFSFLIGRHFLIKTAFTPSISTSYYNPMPLSGGLSLGYSFGLPEHLRSSRAKRLYTAGREYTPVNSIYLELLGGGLLYSMNYERVYIRHKHHSMNNSAGYCFIKLFGNNYNIVPVFINYQYKISKVTSLELGLGIRGVASNQKRWNSQHESYPIRGIDLLGNIGFRYLLTDHLFVKTEIKPIIMNNSMLFINKVPNSIFHWIGLSFGYCWGEGKKRKL